MTPESLAHLLRPVTAEQSLRSYRGLKEEDAPMAGLKTLDRYFFSERLQTKTKGKGRISFYDAFHCPETMAHLRTITERYGKDPTRPIQLYYSFQLWYGSVNQFRPRIARNILQQLSPKVAVLDFSAGWGGRALASLSLGIPYIGIDTNPSLAPHYTAIQQYEPDIPLQMTYQPSETVDFAPLRYDCIFSSPPYYTQEIYPNMPQYSSLADFLHRFLVPVVHSSWKHLMTPGTMALNIPDWLYEELVPLLTLPPLSERIPMPYTSRHTKEGGSATRREWVYVWRKSEYPPSSQEDGQDQNKK